MFCRSSSSKSWKISSTGVRVRSWNHRCSQRHVDCFCSLAGKPTVRFWAHRSGRVFPPRVLLVAVLILGQVVARRSDTRGNSRRRREKPRSSIGWRVAGRTEELCVRVLRVRGRKSSGAPNGGGNKKRRRRSFTRCEKHRKNSRDRRSSIGLRGKRRETARNAEKRGSSFLTLMTHAHSHTRTFNQSCYVWNN